MTTPDPSHDHPHFLRSVIRWLQVGYPHGVPGPDQVPLFALLRSTPLTPAQIAEVVAHLTREGSDAIADGVVDRDEIAEMVSQLTQHDAGPEDVRRVAATLAAAGWPLAGIDVSEVVPDDEFAEAAEMAGRGSEAEAASEAAS